jgi:hypothetical protein
MASSGSLELFEVLEVLEPAVDMMRSSDWSEDIDC